MQIDQNTVKDAALIGADHPRLPGYKLRSRDKDKSVYTKVDAFTGTGSYLVFDHVKKEITVGKVANDDVIKARIALNKDMQNNFQGYKGLVQETAVPETIMQQIKEQSGLEERTGLYDEKKAASILDDSDYKYLKTVPGKISGRTRHI